MKTGITTTPSVLRLFAAAAVLALVLAGCGGSGGAAGGTTGGTTGGTSNGATLSMITVTPATPSIKTGGTQQFTATGLYSNGSTANISSSVTWSSSATGVATVSAAGLASGVSAGTATITATSGLISASTTLSVTAWTTRMNGPRSSFSLDGLAYDGKNYVTVNDALSTSTDLLIWNEQVAMASANDVQWNGSTTSPLYVDAGSGGMSYSSDGLTWRKGFFNSVGKTPYRLAYSSTLPLWVTIAGTQVATSKDGATWTWATLPLAGLPLGANASAVTWTGTQFVAVGAMGTILTSPDGLIWTVQTSGTTQSFSAVGSTSMLIVACTAPPNATGLAGIYTSVDGKAWTFASSTLTGCSSIINAGGQWVAGGFNGVANSANGTIWTLATTQPAGSVNSIIYNGTQYVASGSTPSAKPAIFTSTNGSVWAMKSLYDRVVSIARNPASGLLVAVTSTDRTMVSGDNGATWQYGVVAVGSTAGYLQSVVWSTSLGKFVASGGGTAWGSTDGLNWTALGSGACSGKIGASSTLLVSGCRFGTTPTVMSSTTGVTWTAATTYPSIQWVDGVFSTGTQWIALGIGGDISTSADALIWSKQTSGTTNALYGWATNGILMVVAGAGGTILTSSNGTAWTAQTSNTTQQLNSVTWKGTQFVAVGATGAVVTSADGITWVVQPTPYVNSLFSSDLFNLNDIVWTGTALVTVGDRGLVATSP